MERSEKNKAFLAALVALCMALVLSLAACSPSGDGSAEGGSDTNAATEVGAGSGNIPLDDKLAAKTLIKGASNVFATTDTLTLTDADSPATISMSDPQFDAFFQELLAYKDVADLEVSDCSLDVFIMKVDVATAREDSQQSNYRYTIKGADMTVNGKHITWSKDAGFQED